MHVCGIDHIVNSAHTFQSEYACIFLRNYHRNNDCIRFFPANGDIMCVFVCFVYVYAINKQSSFGSHAICWLKCGMFLVSAVPPSQSGASPFWWIIIIITFELRRKKKGCKHSFCHDLWQRLYNRPFTTSNAQCGSCDRRIDIEIRVRLPRQASPIWRPITRYCKHTRFVTMPTVTISTDSNSANEIHTHTHHHQAHYGQRWCVVHRKQTT